MTIRMTIGIAAAFFVAIPLPLISSGNSSTEKPVFPATSQPLVIPQEQAQSAMLPSAEPSPILFTRPPEPARDKDELEDGKSFAVRAGSRPSPKGEKQAKLSKERKLSPAAARRRARLAREALSYRGTPYVWGGSTPRAFDCSGFTQYLYARQGIKLPHKASLQFKLGKPVKKEDLRPGDLMFFNTTGPISHVGMYIGDGKFVHAANPRRGVVISSMVTGFYARCYAGARRYK